MRETVRICYNDIISIENLLKAWNEFLPGKRRKQDVCEFSLELANNIIALHDDLTNKSYRHGDYIAFRISDPKTRDIHKASVRDRLLHHAIYRILYPYFDRTFFCDSFSCRLGKGTHKAVKRFRRFAIKKSRSNTRTIYVLKCDIKKFFASIDQDILIGILKEYISDRDIIWLLEGIIRSFSPGLPLGNLTSQLLVNIYMNKFDQWMKHKIKAKFYIRYADDFVVLAIDKDYLLELIPKISDFLQEKLELSLHPDKVYIKTFASGVDFLGWINFENHKVLRTSTKRRVIKALLESEKVDTLRSYSGLLKHGNQFRLKQRIEKKIESLTAQN